MSYLGYLYVVCPGHVHSARDDDIHFIGFSQLCRLYGVHPRHCIDYSVLVALRPQSFQDAVADLPRLRPRYDGEYQKPDGSPNYAT